MSALSMSRGKVIGLSLLVIIGAALLSGFAGDIGRALMYRLPSSDLASHPIFKGPLSLEERILNSDVVARVRLLSMDSTVETIYQTGPDGSRVTGADEAEVSALAFRFQVLEYLKGDGGGEIVGIVYSEDFYESRLGALAFGEDLSDAHDTTWDDREAIVFVQSNAPGVGVTSASERSDRYVLGSVANYSAGWMPAAGVGEVASPAGVGGGAQGARSFLTGAQAEGEAFVELLMRFEGTDIDESEILAQAEGEALREMLSYIDEEEIEELLARIEDEETREKTLARIERVSPDNYRVADSAYNIALGAGGASSTMRLSSLRGLVAELEAELATSDGSEEYHRCVLYKYRRNREVEYHAHGGGYDTISYDHKLGSGLPADTVFAVNTMPFPEELDPENYTYANPDIEIVTWLEGKDANLFNIVDDVLLIGNARPLPASEYRFYINGVDVKHILCNAYPDRLRTYEELVVNVSAPAGTLHEAFFDPVHIGDAVGAGGSSGVLQPEWFESEEGETVMERIVWSEGQVEMELSHATDLADYRMDFIALDGSVALRLNFDDAVETMDDYDVATLAWGVCDQPWQEGDLLMLRIAEGIPDDGIQATNDSDCP